VTSPSRRERIEQLLAAEPADDFLRYSLAMELRKEGRHDDSLRWFGELMRQAKPYVPAFHMAGQLLVELGRDVEARGALEGGIAAARQQGNDHAAAEMSELLSSL
jgi:hypothetical protein